MLERERLLFEMPASQSTEERATADRANGAHPCKWVRLSFVVSSKQCTRLLHAQFLSQLGHQAPTEKPKYPIARLSAGAMCMRILSLVVSGTYISTGQHLHIVVVAPKLVLTAILIVVAEVAAFAPLDCRHASIDRQPVEQLDGGQ